MTRKHFQALADGLALVQPDVDHDTAEWQTWRDCVAQVANVCGNANVNFNRDRFHKACGLNAALFGEHTTV